MSGTCSKLPGSGAAETPPCPFTAHSGLTSPHKQIDAQYQRRRFLLATARRLIAEDDSSALTVQRLAHECDTSRQNIHNLVGGKKDIISMSLMEFNEKILMHISATGHGGDVYNSFLYTYKKIAEIYPGYIVGAGRLMMSDYQLYRAIIKKSAHYFMPFVKNFLGASELKKEHWDVSYQLSLVPNNAVRDWIEGGCSVDEMFHNWIFSGDIIMLGAMMKFGADCR